VRSSASVFPDVYRPDSGVALVSPLYVGTRARQLEEARNAAAAFHSDPLPDGFVSYSAFASTDGENLLTYAQWTSDKSYRRFVDATPLGPDQFERAQPIRFVPYRSSAFDGGAVPGLLVAPTFDVDGPDRQRRSIDALVDGPLSRPFPGLIASHFHISLDGSRVLNWAEWADEAAHEAFGRTTLPAECLDAITMPGVRGIGGKRYTLLQSVTRDEPAPAPITSEA
jgi:hypothetical protein